VCYIFFYSDSADDLKIQLYMSAHTNAEVDKDNNSLKVPQTAAERLQHGELKPS